MPQGPGGTTEFCERIGSTNMALRARALLLLLLALETAACSGARGGEAVAPPGIFFPTVPIGDDYPAALIEGTLEVRSGCVFVSRPEDRWLLLWPEGYTATFANDRLEVMNGGGDVVGREGEIIRLGGGEGRPIEMGGKTAAEDWASRLTGSEIPERCGDLYWLVSP